MSILLNLWQEHAESLNLSCHWYIKTALFIKQSCLNPFSNI